MLRALSVAWALLAVLATGFVPPAGPNAQASEVATMGAAGVSGAAPSVSVRRLRAKVTHQEAQADGHHPATWPHALWLLGTARSFVPELVPGHVALAAPALPATATRGTARTSRGPPPSA